MEHVQQNGCQKSCFLMIKIKNITASPDAVTSIEMFISLHPAEYDLQEATRFNKSSSTDDTNCQ